MSKCHLDQHICQTEEWAEFKGKYGTRAVKAGKVLFFLTRVPGTPWNVGYCPKVKEGEVDWGVMEEKARENKCIFVKVEFNELVRDKGQGTRDKEKIRSGKPVFAPYTILLDISKPEEELLTQMHSKTRYNIRLAQRKGIEIVEGVTEEDLGEFLRLQRETAKRQGFHVHPDEYYRTMWEVLQPKGKVVLLLAGTESAEKGNGKRGKEIIAAYVLFRHQDTLYYPYGGSDPRFRNTMASNLLMWEAIRWGKRHGCKLFDMWGATPDKNDPWWGFTRFKLGYGGELVEMKPTVDLVINPTLYQLFKVVDKIRWGVLEMKSRVA